jgi:hypothetical protein
MNRRLFLLSWFRRELPAAVQVQGGFAPTMGSGSYAVSVMGKVSTAEFSARMCFGRALILTGMRIAIRQGEVFDLDFDR